MYGSRKKGPTVVLYKALTNSKCVIVIVDIFDAVMLIKNVLTKFVKLSLCGKQRNPLYCTSLLVFAAVNCKKLTVH